MNFIIKYRNLCFTKNNVLKRHWQLDWTGESLYAAVWDGTWDDVPQK